MSAFTAARFAELHRLICIASILLCGITNAYAAKIAQVQGSVRVQRGNSSLQAISGTIIKEGDEIISAQDAQAFFVFDDGAKGLIRSDSRMIIQELKLQGAAANRQKKLRLTQGSLRYISGKATLRKKVTLNTPTATIGIRGTDLEILITEQAVNDINPGTFLKVNSGAATLTAPDGTTVAANVGEIVYGGEAELASRSAGGRPRASARLVQVESTLFKRSNLDRLMK
jgi:hypothetical protein